MRCTGTPMRLWHEIRHGHRRGRAGTEPGARRHRHRYLGRGFRPARRRRPPGREAPPLSRFPHQRNDGEALRARAARGGIRVHRHPVHADQHALPVVRHEAGRVAPALAAATPVAQHARPVQLLAHGRGQIGSHHRQHHPVLQSRHHELGHRAAAAPGPARRILCPVDPARHAAGQDDGAAPHVRSTPRPGTIPRRRWPRFRPRAATTGATSAPAPGR